MQDSLKTQSPTATHRPASRRSAIAPFVVMDIMRAAYEREITGRDIVHMEVGQPGTPAPRLAREAVKAAIEREVLGYTDALGLPALRERIARHYKDAYGLPVAPERIIVTAGSSAGFVLAFLALFDEGEGVLLPEPGYPCYRNIVQALGLTPIGVPVGPAERWSVTPELLAEALTGGRPASGILFASPNNPTGTVMEPAVLAAICAWCRSHGIAIISDEIYHGLTYDAPAQTALAFDDDAIVINSFSKYFSMTGWRIGWMVVPAGLVRTVERLAQNFYISPTTVSQIAALAAFEATEELEANKAVYAANRALLMEELPRAGFSKFAPVDGAFYFYADVSDLTDDSEVLARHILDELGVAVTPGVDFDPVRGRQFLRFSYAGTTEAMAEAARRLKALSRRERVG
jgi:aspartate/methionine/tyrosine aminotransferase